MPTKQLDGFAVLAFALAMVIMVLPIEADMVFVLLGNKKIALAAAIAMACIVTVLVPVVFSWRRQRSAPEVWGGRGYLRGAITILIINLLMTGLTVFQIVLRGATRGN
jgi:membrane protease YdiL (CAAX protease family)